MRKKTCCFVGHRLIFHDGIEKNATAVIERLVDSCCVTQFLTGGMGEFDNILSEV